MVRHQLPVCFIVSICLRSLTQVGTHAAMHMYTVWTSLLHVFTHVSACMCGLVQNCCFRSHAH